MNLLSLISPWLDIICQVITKCATVSKPTTFHQALLALVASLGWKLIGKEEERISLIFTFTFLLSWERNSKPEMTTS